MSHDIRCQCDACKRQTDRLVRMFKEDILPRRINLYRSLAKK